MEYGKNESWNNWSYRICGKNKKVNLDILLNTLEDIENNQGKCVFIIACTELSLYAKSLSTQYTIVDSMDIIARQAVIKCGFTIKEEY